MFIKRTQILSGSVSLNCYVDVTTALYNCTGLFTYVATVTKGSGGLATCQHSFIGAIFLSLWKHLVPRNTLKGRFISSGLFCLLAPSSFPTSCYLHYFWMGTCLRVIRGGSCLRGFLCDTYQFASVSRRQERPAGYWSARLSRFIPLWRDFRGSLGPAHSPMTRWAIIP